MITQGNLSQFADYIGYTRGAVSQFKAAGKLVFVNDEQTIIDFEASKARLGLFADPTKGGVKDRHEFERKVKNGNAENDLAAKLALAIKKEELLKKRADRIVAESKVGELKNQLLPVDDITFVLAQIISDVRNSFENMEYKVSAVLPEPYKTQTAENIRAEIQEILTSAHQQFQNIAQNVKREIEAMTEQTQDTDY